MAQHYQGNTPSFVKGRQASGGSSSLWCQRVGSGGSAPACAPSRTAGVHRTRRGCLRAPGARPSSRSRRARTCSLPLRRARKARGGATHYGSGSHDVGRLAARKCAQGCHVSCQQGPSRGAPVRGASSASSARARMWRRGRLAHIAPCNWQAEGQCNRGVGHGLQEDDRSETTHAHKLFNRDCTICTLSQQSEVSAERVRAC